MIEDVIGAAGGDITSADVVDSASPGTPDTAVPCSSDTDNDAAGASAIIEPGT